MAIRHPPDENVPRIIRRTGVPPGRPRVLHYDEPQPGFMRRLIRILLKPYLIIPALVIVALAGSILIYYWFVFSARIDNLLKGEVFTRSAGIYAAPKQIRAGQNISEDDLVAYLKRAGYVERNQT